MQAVEAKCGVQRDGWDVQGSSSNHSCIWKGVVAIREAFGANISFKVGSGEKILFWKDVWVEGGPLEVASLGCFHVQGTVLPMLFLIWSGMVKMSIGALFSEETLGRRKNMSSLPF